MTNRAAAFWLFAFLLAAGVQLAVELVPWPAAEFWVKPALMPLLIALVWSVTVAPRAPSIPLLLLGLVLSWFGDVFLLPWPGEGYFLWGLTAFLLAHLSYIGAFWQWPGSRRSGGLFRRPVLVIPFLVVLLGLLFWLWPGIGPAFRIPVVLYAVVLVGMALSAWHLHSLLPRPYGSWLYAGALLFLLSDTLLAAGRFEALSLPSPVLGVGVMATYMAAQLGIALGLAKSAGH